MSASLQIPVPVELTLSDPNLPLSADRKAAFFNALITTGGHLGKACALAKVSRQRVLEWRQTDAIFARAYNEALEYGTENLEEALYARGLNTDTTAAIFLLKARRPEKYRETVKVETAPTDSKQLASEIVAALLELRQQAQAGEVEGQPAQQLTTTTIQAHDDDNNNHDE